MKTRILPYAVLETSASFSLERAVKASKLPATITSSFRDDDHQARIFLDRYVESAGPNDKGPHGDRRGPYQGKYWKRVKGLPVAVPGTSKHGKGLAIDVPTTSKFHAWLVKNGLKHGWVQTLPKTDTPHFEYQIARDEVRKAKVARIKKRDTARALVKNVRKTLGLRGWKAPKAQRERAQRLLQATGYYTGRIDGRYGPLNKTAWRAAKAAAK